MEIAKKDLRCGKTVFENPVVEKLRREHSLCALCKEYDSLEPTDMCPIMWQLFNLSKNYCISYIVTRCPKFQAKDATTNIVESPA